jgi:peroxiredoxin
MSFQPLHERSAALQAERERSWPPEQLAKNARQRAVLAQRFDPAAIAQPGQRLADARLVDQNGQRLTLSALTAHGAAVLVFFRFGGCPACNIALPYYDQTLAAPLKAAGIPLVAVSAQVPVDRGIIERHHLSFPVAGDPNYALARELGITFLPEEQPAVPPASPGSAPRWAPTAEIDQPAVLILDPGLVVRRFWVSPDWLARTEAADILAALPEAARAAA